MTKESCDACAAPDARVHFGDERLCDRCADKRLAERAGWSELGEPPSPLRLAGPDGVDRELRYRWWRAPTGICVELEELDAPVGEGFRFAVLGGHEADLSALVDGVTGIAAQEVGRWYLERSTRDGTWTIAGDEVAGRFLYSEDHPEEAHHVVVDGRTLSWNEFGHALGSLEGWEFRLAITDHITDVRDDARILPFPSRDTSGESDRTDPTRAWTVAELRDAVVAYEQHLRHAGVSAGSIRTHLDRTGTFIAWLAGETSTAKASAAIPDGDVDVARGWARARNDRLPERAIGQIRFEVDIEGPSVTICECRPPWRPEDGPEWTRLPIVRFRYARGRREWATYRRDRNSKFQCYDPMPPSRNLQALIDAVEADRSGIFWG